MVGAGVAHPDHRGSAPKGEPRRPADSVLRAVPLGADQKEVLSGSFGTTVNFLLTGMPTMGLSPFCVTVYYIGEGSGWQPYRRFFS
jgi:hypothetical protein